MGVSLQQRPNSLTYPDNTLTHAFTKKRTLYSSASTFGCMGLTNMVLKIHKWLPVLKL